MKFVVIVETDDDFQMCIGVYDNPREAYGAAYCWLDDLLDGALEVGKDDGMSISPLYPLGTDGDTGWGMKLVGNEKIQERVHILFCEDKKDNTGSKKSNWV